MRALRRLTVRAKFPPQLEPLTDIVNNLRWSWHPDSQDLFESVDPQLWRACNGDPGKMLGEVSGERLAELARERRFLRRLSDVGDDLRDYLSAPRWYQRRAESSDAGRLPKCIAYFSPEFGITEVLPQYSGGLGVLAGDHIKAASDLGVPIIGVGLLYRSGYFRQSLSQDGWQLEHYPPIDPQGLPIKLVRRADGEVVKVSLALPGGRTLVAQVGRPSAGCLLLMDSDVEENDTAARATTDRRTEVARNTVCTRSSLGVGGVRVARTARQPAPLRRILHTNEGTPASSALNASASSWPTTPWISTRPSRASAPAPSSPPTRRCPQASTGSRPSWCGTRSPTSATCRSTACCSWAPRPIQPYSTWPMGLRLASARTVSPSCTARSAGRCSALWPEFDARGADHSVTNGVHAPTWMARGAGRTR